MIPRTLVLSTLVIVTLPVVAGDAPEPAWEELDCGAQWTRWIGAEATSDGAPCTVAYLRPDNPSCYTPEPCPTDAAQEAAWQADMEALSTADVNASGLLGVLRDHLSVVRNVTEGNQHFSWWVQLGGPRVNRTLRPEVRFEGPRVGECIPIAQYENVSVPHFQGVGSALSSLPGIKATARGSRLPFCGALIAALPSNVDATAATGVVTLRSTAPVSLAYRDGDASVPFEARLTAWQDVGLSFTLRDDPGDERFTLDVAWTVAPLRVQVEANLLHSYFAPIIGLGGSSTEAWQLEWSYEEPPNGAPPPACNLGASAGPAAARIDRCQPGSSAVGVSLGLGTGAAGPVAGPLSQALDTIFPCDASGIACYPTGATGGATFVARAARAWADRVAHGDRPTSHAWLRTPCNTVPAFQGLVGWAGTCLRAQGAEETQIPLPSEIASTIEAGLREFAPMFEVIVAHFSRWFQLFPPPPVGPPPSGPNPHDLECAVLQALGQNPPACQG